PHQPTVTEIRITTIVACLEPPIKLLNTVHDAFGTPFVPAISNTTQSLITGIQNAKKNKEECIQLMEHVHQVLYALVNLHLKGETPGSLPPTTLYHVGRFMDTLHKIYTFVEAQQEGNRIKSFFRQSEINTLLKNCRAGIQDALQVFKIETGATTLTNAREIQIAADSIHQELLELISTLSDEGTSDQASSMYSTLNGSQMSSQSFTLLPAKPKIFHGRELELGEITTMLSRGPARIAILGPGGIGKTSLVKAVLHHPDVIAKYNNRFFVASDSAATSIDIAALIGAHIGLNPGRDLTKPVLQYLSRKGPSLLVLDNLETTWEPTSSCGGVEELLSLLADIEHVGLIITMRGAERPTKVRWTRPFLPPLEPLSAQAAKKMFIDIADDVHAPKDIEQLLRLTDNLPLAVDLIAHLVDYDGCASVLARWETEKTSLLSAGYDKRSNLDASIAMSLLSPRLVTWPGAIKLLSLLSILPDGLSDTDLIYSNLPIQDVLACKAVLLSTSLIFLDNKKRIKSLMPIRDHMQYFHPVTTSMVESLRKYFHGLLDLYRKYKGSQQVADNINQITLNLNNLQQLLSQELSGQNPDLADTIACIVSLNEFSGDTGRGWIPLMDKVPHVFPQPCDHGLELHFITEIFMAYSDHPVASPDSLVEQAMSHLTHLHDPGLECQFYIALGAYHTAQTGNLSEAIKSLETALILARSTEETNSQAIILDRLAGIKWRTGEYTIGHTLAADAQRLAKLSPNFYTEARALRTQSMCSMSLGDYKDIGFLLHRARELLKMCGMSNGFLYQHLMLSEAEVHLFRSEYQEARNIYLHILEVTSPDQDPNNHAYALLNIAIVDAEISGREDDTYRNIDQARTLFGRLAYVDEHNFCEVVMGQLQLAKGETFIAKATFEKYLQLFWIRHAEGTSYCLERLADTSRWGVSDSAWTSRYAVVYLAFSMKTQNRLALHRALRCLADVFLVHGDEATAEKLFNVALKGFSSMGIYHDSGICMLRLGDLGKKQGDHVKAAALWTEAQPQFERALQTKDAACIEERLADLERENSTNNLGN
ncbi:hypothetical protein C8F04DRAFT_604874, partial [Mycena alexandri]